MNIIQKFYDNLASHYDKLFLDWQSAAQEQAVILDRIFAENGYNKSCSIRDYDMLLIDKPAYSPPYIHKTEKGQRVSFQTWNWEGDNYRLIQYIVDDEETLQVSKFECEYRATRRAEMTTLFMENGCSEVKWMFPEETGFYQPIVIAKKF